MKKNQELILLPNLSLTKNSMSELSDSIANRVKEGEINPLETYIKLDAVEKTAKEAKSKIVNEAISETDNYNRHERKLIGVDFNTSTRKPTRDFSKHERMKSLIELVEKTQKEIKALEKSILAMIDAGGTVLDEESGQMLTTEDFPIKSLGTTSIRLSYPKSEAV